MIMSLLLCCGTVEMTFHRLKIPVFRVLAPCFGNGDVLCAEITLLHTCQVLGKSKSEIARAPLILAYNVVIERAEKSGAQV